MKKADRQKVFDKYGGHCAYCGCELVKGWHVDEIEPVRRTWEYVADNYGYNTKKKYIGSVHPERFHIDNQNPACASCNINKHSMPLEEFRNAIKQFVQSLNLYSTQYKIAKRYNLISENDIEVKFYFETIEENKLKAV